MKVLPSVAVLGAGHLGECVLAALLRSRLSADRVRATTARADHAEQIRARYGVETGTDNAAAIEGRDVVILTVRPEQARAVLAVIGAGASATLVSFVAGLTLNELSTRWSGPVVRVATSAAAASRGGLLAVSAAGRLEPVAADVLSRIGIVLEVPETEQDVAAAALGSAAAFLAALAEGVYAAAVAGGSRSEHAQAYVVDALCSAATLWQADVGDGQSPWAALVTPNGITAVGLTVLTTRRAADSVADAVSESIARAGRLGISSH